MDALYGWLAIIVIFLIGFFSYPLIIDSVVKRQKQQKSYIKIDREGLLNIMKMMDDRYWSRQKLNETAIAESREFMD